MFQGTLNCLVIEMCYINKHAMLTLYQFTSLDSVLTPETAK